MGTRPKDTQPKRRPRNLPSFISKPEMADVLRCSQDTISDWVRDGHFPPPARYPGPRRQISLWKLEHFLAFTEMGEWPEEARQ